MRVERDLSHGPQGADKLRPKADVGDKVAVHDVNMDVVRPGGRKFFGRFRERAEVGGQDRRRNSNGHRMGLGDTPGLERPG